MADSGAVEREQRGEQRARHAQRRQVDLRRIEDRDHQDRPEVVRDRERGQEDDQVLRNAPARSARMPTAKAMSVAIGMPHPPRPGAPAFERSVDERGHDHAPDGRAIGSAAP